MTKRLEDWQRKRFFAPRSADAEDAWLCATESCARRKIRIGDRFCTACKTELFQHGICQLDEIPLVEHRRCSDCTILLDPRPNAKLLLLSGIEIHATTRMVGSLCQACWDFYHREELRTDAILGDWREQESA